MNQKIISSPPRHKKTPVLEKIAFDPFISQQTLINELIRNMVNPDIDQGQTYYIGQVVKKIRLDDDGDISARDIFYSPTDNYERASKPISDIKSKTGRVMLFVHVPSFITSDRITVKDLNIDNFNKLRVEHNDTDLKVEVGNLVKIQFRDKNGFYDPFVVSVEQTSLTVIMDQASSAKSLFKSYLDCRVNNLNFETDINSNNLNKKTNPSLGYVQALKEIENVFSSSFINGFKKLYKNKVDFSDKTVIELRFVQVDKEVYSNFKDNFSFNYILEPQQFKVETNYIIKIFSKFSSDSLRNLFYSYLEEYFYSRFNNILADNKDEDEGSFSLDLNLNVLLNKKQKLIADYIFVSKKFIDSKFYYEVTEISGNNNNSLKQTESPNTCEAPLWQAQSDYKIVYPFQKDLVCRLDHKTELESFSKLNNSWKNDFTYNDFYIILGKTEEEVYNGKSSFYTTKKTGQNTSYKKQKETYISKEAMRLNLNEMASFLNNLRRSIAQVEGVASENVLIYPLQIIKLKNGGLKKEDQDPNSRHYYGKAADISIYIRYIESNGNVSIKQLPQEMVVLYAEKSKPNNIVLGHGIFLNTNDSYSHIEFLDPGSGLTQEEMKQRIYIGGSENDESYLGKQINNASENKLSIIKQYVRETYRDKFGIGKYSLLTSGS